MDQEVKLDDGLSVLSIAAIVFAVPCVIAGPLALIPFVLSVAAIVNARRSKRSGNGVAYVALVLSCIGLWSTKVYLDARYNAVHMVSRTHLRMHGQGFLMYAGNNQDRLPSADEWPEVIIDQGIVDESLFVAPNADDDGVSYVYLEGAELWNETSILIYEDPKHWDEGVLVCFGDAHVELIDHDVFEQMLAEQLEEEYTNCLVGTYNSTMGFDMIVTASRGKLFAQITGQQPLALALVSENRFRVILVEAEIGFQLPEEGEATSVTLYQNGMEIKCERKE
jgi:Domain of unknown function (DUF3471)